MKRYIFFTCVYFMLSIYSSTNAQVCFRYDEQENCSSYPITDFMVNIPIPGIASRPERHLDLATNLGWLFNVDKRWAVGPSFFFSAYLNGGWNSQLGVHLRARHYLTKDLHLDVSPGFIIWDNPLPEGFAGYSSELAIGFGDWISLTSRFDYLRAYPEDYIEVFQIGIKFGSYAGLGLSGLATVAGGIYYLLSRID